MQTFGLHFFCATILNMKKGKDCVGIFVAGIFHDGEGNFLMGKRGGQARDRHGEWEFGGGTLEMNETLEEALRRETREEFGAEISDVRRIDVSETINENGHWVGIFYMGKIDRQSVCINEPVYDEIGWFTPNSLPEPVCKREIELIEKYKNLL